MRDDVGPFSNAHATVAPKQTPLSPSEARPARPIAWAAAACVGLGTLAPPTWAQEPQAQPTPATAEAVLPDVAVTATRQPMKVLNTPAAVSVVNAAQVREAGVGINLSESLGGVAGVTALNRQNLAQDLQISSRGFGARATFGVRGVRLIEDGIPLTMPDGQGQSSSFDISEVQRIEVLRGPASALYGNASGGVIAVFTRDGTEVPEFSVRRSMSRDNTQKTTVGASGRKGDVTYAVDASHASTDGYREHSKATREQWRAKLGWQATAATRLTFISSYVSMPLVEDPLGLTPQQWRDNPSQAGTNALAYNARKGIDHSQVGLVLDHRVDDANQLRAMVYRGQRAATQWQAIPAGSQGSAANPGGVIDLNRDFGGGDVRHTHQSTLAGLPWQWTWGASIDTLREQRRGYQNFIGSQLGVTGALRRDELNRATSRDVYALSQLDVHPDWRLSLGWRQSQVAFRSVDRYIVTGNSDDSGRMDFTGRNPTASLMWRFQPNWQTYVSLGRSMETPTLNEVAYRSNTGTTTGWNLGLQASKAFHREWGVKYSSDPGSARPDYSAQAAVFDVSASQEIAVLVNSGGRATYQNVGHTRRRGVELEQHWQLARTVALDTAATWTTAHYQDPFNSTSAGSTQVVQAGANLPGLPQRQVQADLVWRPAAMPWHAGLTWRHVGRIYANDINTVWAPASRTWSARMVWRTQLANWRVDTLARIDNLLNEHTVGSVIVNEANGRYYEPAPGRSATVAVNFTHAFD